MSDTKIINDLKNLKYCVPFTGNFKLMSCLEAVSDVLMELLGLTRKFYNAIYSQINKLVTWIFEKIPFLKNAVEIGQQLIDQVLSAPFKQCQQKTNFDFNV